MCDNWKQQTDEYLRLAYHINSTTLIDKYKKTILDRCLRSASDIISCESISVHNNTMSMLQWCRRWSVDALNTYDIVKTELTHARNGKPPTHRQVCDARDSARKRYWTVEHEHPLIIPKDKLLTNSWTFEDLSNWMYTYGYATIVTQQENKKLKTYTKDMDEAAMRYADADILVTIHPHHKGDKK